MTLEYFENTSLLNNSVAIYSFLEGVVTKEDDIYCSLCLDLNVASEGETLEESKNNLLEAVRDYIDLAKSNNIHILRQVPIKDNPIYNGEEIIDNFRIETNVDICEYA